MKLADRELVEKATLAGESSAYFSRAIAPHPADAVPRPTCERKVSFYKNGVEIADPALWQMQGHIFYDGACTRDIEDEFSRAVWGVIQLGLAGNVVATLSGPVPASLPQSSQAAEHAGRIAAVECLAGPSIL